MDLLPSKLQQKRSCRNTTENVVMGWRNATQPKRVAEKFVPSKRHVGCIVWHRETQFGSLEALKTLWNLAKEVELDTW